MLWRKSWLDTRWRFLCGFALVLLSALGVLTTYDDVQRILPTLGASPLEGANGPLGSALAAALELQRTFRGFVWQQWFAQNLTYLGMAFAVFLGSGSVLAGSSGGTLFSLALPVSRGQWIVARAATGLTELFILIMVPSVAIALFSPVIGEHFGVGDAIVHGACVFVVAAVFFGVAVTLSTVFDDLWRPLLLTYLIAMCLSFGERALPGVKGLFDTMAGESYFRDGSLPWVGLLISVALTAALLFAAAAHVARRDF